MTDDEDALFDPFVIVVSKQEVDSCDIEPALSLLKQLYGSPRIAKQFQERVDIAFDGYNEHPSELFEIQEVREFVSKLDGHFPFWFFFMSKYHLGLQCILYCFLPPFLKEEARNRIFPERINQLLSNRWYPALAQICEFVGMSEEEFEQLCMRGVSYIFEGRFRLDSEQMD